LDAAIPSTFAAGWRRGKPGRALKCEATTRDGRRYQGLAMKGAIQRGDILGAGPIVLVDLVPHVLPRRRIGVLGVGKEDARALNIDIHG